MGGIFDISLNNNFPNSTNMPSINFDFNSNNFNDAVSQLSNAMLSSLSGAMNNPDNSGNTIRADYSLFVPHHHLGIMLQARKRNHSSNTSILSYIKHNR